MTEQTIGLDDTLSLPGSIDPTRSPWAGTLRELLSVDYDHMTRDMSYLPQGTDGELDTARLTLAHVRRMTDDPNATLA